MSFSVYINNICSKASKVLNFINCNLNECYRDVKCIAYQSLVRPILEYSSPVWDPHLNKDIQTLEKCCLVGFFWLQLVQQCVHHAQPSRMANLAERHPIHILQNCLQSVCSSNSIILSNHHHSSHTPIPSTTLHDSSLNNTWYCMNSFYPRTIHDWNNLPTSLIELDLINTSRGIFYNYIYIQSLN